MKIPIVIASFFLALAPSSFAQLAVYDPANHAVNAAIQANQQANHVETLNRWAEQLEKLNRQIRQIDDLIATQRRIREVTGDPVAAGVHIAGALGAHDFARSYGETMRAVRRLSDAVHSLQRTAEGLYRRLDDKTSLGTGFTRRVEFYKPYAAIERQADNLETVDTQTNERSAALQTELSETVSALRDAPTQADVDKLNVKVAALNGQLSHLAAQRQFEAEKLRAQQILNENQAAKERQDLWEKQIAEERQTLATVNAWQQSLRLTPTTFTR
jgi:hypothetical protein